MKNGSLDRLVKRTSVAGENGNSFKNAVLKRIRQRFNLLESIRISGYTPDHKFHVIAIMTHNDQFKLISGHHRTAILAALGYDSVPDVYVFNRNTMWLFYRALQRLKKVLGVHKKKA